MKESAGQMITLHSFQLDINAFLIKSRLIEFALVGY